MQFHQIKHPLSASLRQKMNELEHYIDNQVVCYGSVLRSDYVHMKSDIDMAIFCPNEESMMSQLQHFFARDNHIIDKQSFDKVVWKLNGNMIYGYKLKMDMDQVPIEISIYNEEFKAELLDDFAIPLRNTSIVLFIALYLIKTFHYLVPLIPKSLYVEWKRIILSQMNPDKQSVFYLMSNKPK